MIILYALLSMYALWTLFLAIMNLKRARDAGTLTKWGERFAIPILGLGYLTDAAVNIFVVTVLLLEIPQEILVTSRMSRHIKDGSGWRYSFCKFICSNLLDPFDPSGCHCK